MNVMDSEAIGGESSDLHQSLLALHPAEVTCIMTVDQQFQSFNVEMVEVTEERFWKLYSK